MPKPRRVKPTADTPDAVLDAFLFGHPTKPAIAIAHDIKTFRVEDTPPEFIDALEAEIAQRMLQPLSRERQVANELQLYLELNNPIVTDEDWLAFARHMIETVNHARDLSAEDVAAAMNSPPRFRLPEFDDL